MRAGLNIVFELGINHNGSVELAERMIRESAEAGADGVKLQLYDTDDFVGPGESWSWELNGETVTEKQADLFRRCELDRPSVKRLVEYAHSLGLMCGCTATSISGADFLESIDVDWIKIGSDDAVYAPLVEHVASLKTPMVISLGMFDADDARWLAGSLAREENLDYGKVWLLHCCSLYPAPLDAIGLGAMREIKARWPMSHVGFSDHTDGVAAAAAAVGAGAEMIEKHVTIDRYRSGPDDAFSLELGLPAKQWVRALRDIYGGLTSTQMSEAETRMRSVARRSCVAARALAKGETLDASSIAYKRPGTGLVPYRAHEIIGKRLRRAMRAGDQIRPGDCE
jgi:sialic acid synthase SpsE